MLSKTNPIQWYHWPAQIKYLYVMQNKKIKITY